MYSQFLVDDDAGIAEIVKAARRVAVLGAEGEDEPSLAAYLVPDWLRRHGVDILPVPAGANPPAELYGAPAYGRLADVPGPVDVVDVFLRSKDVPPRVPELLALRPSCVWMQLGIRNEIAAEALARAGIKVVQDRCLREEYRKHVLGK
jgi:uncharacterized protein